MTTPENFGRRSNSPYQYDWGMSVSLFSMHSDNTGGLMHNSDKSAIADDFEVNTSDTRPVTEQALTYAKNASPDSLDMTIRMALRAGRNGLRDVDEAGLRGLVTAAAKDTILAIADRKIEVEDPGAAAKRIMNLIVKINRTRQEGPLPRPQR